MLAEKWPQWTSEIRDESVVGEDQLGIAGAAQSYQQDILPGIITVTDHARYYSLYAWILYRFIQDENSSRLLKDFRGKYFRRHEVALIIGAFSHHMDNQLLTGVVGSGLNSSGARNYWESSDVISLEQNYFINRLGGFGQYYRTAMENMGIVEEPEKPYWVYRLTDRGKLLAEAYQNSIKHTKYFQKLALPGDLETITRIDAIEYGQAGCLCNDALQFGEDRKPLLDSFFRFEEAQDFNNQHVRRRNSLGVALDIVKMANGEFITDMLRPALYLGEYKAGMFYKPSSELTEWAQRWQMVEVRHLYTFGIQCMWAAFLLELKEKLFITREEWDEWILSILNKQNWNLKFTDFIEKLCHDAGLKGNLIQLKQSVKLEFTLKSGLDEYSLYLKALGHNGDSQSLLLTGIAILSQLYLRYFPVYSLDNEIWRSMATRERLPLNDYWLKVSQFIGSENLTLMDWIKWIFQEYIFEQHEMIALEKYRSYDTFKFYYEQGVFNWPTGKKPYQEPIRLAANRIDNCLSMLIDLGLVNKKKDGKLELSAEGEEYHNLVIRGLSGGI